MPSGRGRKLSLPAGLARLIALNERQRLAEPWDIAAGHQRQVHGLDDIAQATPGHSAKESRKGFALVDADPRPDAPDVFELRPPHRIDAVRVRVVRGGTYWIDAGRFWILRCDRFCPRFSARNRCQRLGNWRVIGGAESW